MDGWREEKEWRRGEGESESRKCGKEEGGNGSKVFRKIKIDSENQKEKLFELFFLI